MRIALASLLALHALIHLVGFAHAFGFASATPLTTPISRPMGAIWLLASGLLLAASVGALRACHWFWLVAVLGTAASQFAIVGSWRDARFGTLANVVVLAAALIGAVMWGPFGLRAEYRERRTRELVATAPCVGVVSEDELAPLPAPVQRYLRYAGVVGKPHVQSFRARFRGRIRSSPDAPWMHFVGEQQNTVVPPTRLFFMRASMHGFPVDAFHGYDHAGARMRVKLLSLFPVVDAAGYEFTRAETVTLLNDMSIMAPASLLSPAIQWTARDDLSAEAIYTQGPHTVRAVLVFEDTGALVDFWSDDRPALAPDGVHFIPQRWSTPIGEYRAQGTLKLASRGEARYATRAGEYAYIELQDIAVQVNPDAGAM